MKNKTFAAGALLALAAAGAQAATVLNEGFENFAGALAAGWVRNNLSSPVGEFGWEQGFPVFTAQAGTANSFAVTNFQAAASSGGSVDNWLMTPTLTFDANNTLSFWTRTFTSPSDFPDRLEVRLSTAGTSSAPTNFTTVLLTINPTLSGTGYPAAWTQFNTSFTLSPGTTGRLAFRYLLPDNVSYSDIVGLDSVSVNVTPVPEPQIYALMVLGLGAVVGAVRRKRKAA